MPKPVTSVSRLPYTVELFWNGAKVADITATCVMASDIVKDFMSDNFAGVDHMEWCVRLPGLLDKLLAGQTVELAYHDETGAASAFLKPTART